MKGHHKRYWRNHGGKSTIRTSITDDLWEPRDCGYETECWVWLGRSLNQYGHGKVTMGRRVVGAHRAMYEQMVGSIPDGLELDHLCRNPPCIRPDHLEPVTHSENIRRSRLAKLNAEKVRLIRSSDIPAQEMAQIMGVTAGTIYHIRAGKSWTDV